VRGIELIAQGFVCGAHLAIRKHFALDFVQTLGHERNSLRASHATGGRDASDQKLPDFGVRRATRSAAVAARQGSFLRGGGGGRQPDAPELETALRN